MIISDFTNKETKSLTFTEITRQCYFLCEEEPITPLLDSEKSLSGTEIFMWEKKTVEFRFHEISLTITSDFEVIQLPAIFHNPTASFVVELTFDSIFANWNTKRD